jgi:hypothetical protein
MSQKENAAEKNPLYYHLMVCTHVGGTPLSCPNTITLNMTTTADAAQFILQGQVVLRGVQHFWVICAKAAVIFCQRSVSFCGLFPYKSDLTYPHTKKSGSAKSGEFRPITAAPVIVACVI